ncbi:hypothetical protein L914_17805 [Phytophthora nicotianae]|uniref:Uncharacterized protein n=2 Tax=Phytophthora nicotianae TaxID=4792 RepID=W2MIH9_PHYNI|nr:hypothetical protein L914_17805 [Phytophthora nicotianae]
MGEGVGDADVSVIDAAAVVISTSGNDGHLPRGNAASGNNVTNGGEFDGNRRRDKGKKTSVDGTTEASATLAARHSNDNKSLFFFIDWNNSYNAVVVAVNDTYLSSPLKLPVRLADSGPAIGEKDGTDSGKQVDSGDAIGGIDGGKSAADRSGDIPAPQADTGMECVGNVDSETEAHWKQRADTPVVVTDGSTGSEKLGQPGDDAGRDGGSTDEYEGCREAGGCDGIGVQNRAEVSGKARGTALQHPVSGSDPTIVKNSGGGPTGVIETKGVNVKKGDTPVGDGGTAGY